MGRNPHTTANQQSEQSRRRQRLQIGRVDTAPKQGSRGLYHAEVDGEIAHFHPTVHGDLYIPPEGSWVSTYETMEGDTYALQSVYIGDNPVPSITPGERVLSHPLSYSNIYFQSDGTLTLSGDDRQTVELPPSGDVVIDGGTTRAITDVSLNTTTDSDGHVTNVSLSTTRSPNVYLPTPE